MSRQNIAIGNTGNDGTGDPLRIGGNKINLNFVELYTNATNSQMESASNDTIKPSILKVYYGWVYWIQSKTISALNTTVKTIVGAINELYTVSGNDTTSKNFTVTVTEGQGQTVSIPGSALSSAVYTPMLIGYIDGEPFFPSFVPASRTTSSFDINSDYAGELRVIIKL